MYRLIAAAAISFVILGGLALFMERRESRGSQTTANAPIAAAGDFSVDVTLSFTAAERDPFAVTVENSAKPPIVIVRLNGKELLSATEAPPAGELLKVDHVPGMAAGKNEFLVEADPPLAEANRAHAVRLRVLRDGQPIAEQTSWSEPGSRLVARFVLDVPADGRETAATLD
ncbi:MAG: hypothetical protein SGJ19_18890 [Planctomycetia bacterium]|nr:hypothetical protein [Planctomycetia bacterium]